MATKPGNYDITIYQGMDLDLTFTWKDSAGNLINLTGYTARLMVRVNIDDASPVISLTDGGAANGITLGGAAGTIRVQRTGTMTAAYTFTRGVYDLELVSGAVVTRLLEGQVIVSKEVTR